MTDRGQWTFVTILVCCWHVEVRSTYGYVRWNRQEHLPSDRAGKSKTAEEAGLVT